MNNYTDLAYLACVRRSRQDEQFEDLSIAGNIQVV